MRQKAPEPLRVGSDETEGGDCELFRGLTDGRVHRDVGSS